MTYGSAKKNWVDRDHVGVQRYKIAKDNAESELLIDDELEKSEEDSDYNILQQTAINGGAANMIMRNR